MQCQHIPKVWSSTVSIIVDTVEDHNQKQVKIQGFISIRKANQDLKVLN